MRGAQLASVLSGTLSPSTVEQSEAQLKAMSGEAGLAVELLVLGDCADYALPVRQAALAYLSNLVRAHCEGHQPLPADDLQRVRASLLEALIRNVTAKPLAGVLRQMVVLLAEKYYPREWPQLVEEAARRATQAVDFQELLGSVEALRAVFGVFGASVMREIELGNLCNRAVGPLLGLASRLLQSFGAETSVVLLSVMKALAAAVQFHLPEFIAANIHSLMIFVKKLLDLEARLDAGAVAVYQLKRTCLRILFRLYQRHANPRITTNRNFAAAFHAKYTRPLVETLVLQVLAEGGEERETRHRHMELMRMALSCLAYINRQSPDAAALLLQHRSNLVALCLSRLRLNLNRSYQSYVDFRHHVQEARVQFKEFFFSLMRCEALPEQQGAAVAALLELLVGYLRNGDAQAQEVALYVFAEMSAEVKFLAESVEESMGVLMVSELPRLLGEDQHVLVRMRACQLLASYSYVDLPAEHLQGLAGAVYNCLLAGSADRDSFLKIHACNAFNSLLRYPPIVEFVRPHLQAILGIYTSLLETDACILKNFEDLLSVLEDEIVPFANDLLLLLVSLFHRHARHDYGDAQDDNEQPAEDDDEDSAGEEEDTNSQAIAKACVSSIRQLLQAERAQVGQEGREALWGVVAWVFADRAQLFLEEGFNVLNLLLYKLRGPPEPRSFLFFKAIAHALLGLPPGLTARLRCGSPLDQTYADILENVSAEPDSDLLENCIGCLRNFLAKSPRGLLLGEVDDAGAPLLESAFRIVREVHENAQGRSSQTDRLIVLTAYVTLVEHRVLGEGELAQVAGQVAGWLRMEQEALGPQAAPARYVYSPVYLQVLLLAVHFYGAAALRCLDPGLLVDRLLFLRDSFRCDYELARVLVGVADLLALRALDHPAAAGLLAALPEWVRRACQLRTEGRQQQQPEMDDEAEEEQLLGNDENSMAVGWSQGASARDLQLGEEEEDNDWEEEFNKFYDSPLDALDEVRCLQAALSADASSYCALLSPQAQSDLALYFANIPPKP